MAKNARDVAAQWAAKMATSGDKFKAGVQAVTVNPAEQAIRQKDVMIANLVESVNNGKWEAGLRRTNLEGWRQSMLTKGARNMGPGAKDAQPDFEQFMVEFLPHIEQGKALLASMPRGDLQTNINRAVTMMQHNAKFRRRS